jgi:hypothetical protein
MYLEKYTYKKMKKAINLWGLQEGKGREEMR